VLQLNRKYVYYTGAGLLIIVLLLAAKKAFSKPSFDIPEGFVLVSNNQVLLWVSALEQAFYDVGTNTEAVFDVFEQVQNDGQLAQLIQGFGFRDYSGGLLPYYFYSKMDLPMQLREELSSSEISQVNSILASNGITYTF